MKTRPRVLRAEKLDGSENRAQEESQIIQYERPENMGKLVVGAPGFEPGASCAQGRRATRLRYAPT